jgi:hypothetical protein
VKLPLRLGFKFALYLRQTLIFWLSKPFNFKRRVSSHFVAKNISYTDIVQVFQSMFSDEMIANKRPLENRSMLFGSLWNPSIFDEINQKKDKKKKIYMFSY